ncbi:MAG: hypothetical protein GDA68_14620 [Nitrospira sp. CR2.1]|nr:hypothetical protein [Nitrospira sp. CR2.1]
MDELNRHRIASTIFDLGINRGEKNSTRIGIYGRWGEGKTTVLKFIRDLGRDKHYPIAWFNPWKCGDQIHLWADFYLAVMEAFPLSKVGKSFDLKSWFAENLPLVTKIPWIKNAVGSAPEIAVSYFMKHIRDDISAQLNALPIEQQKLIIIIDDLDRTSPVLTPHLLLGILEELDIPNCIYVVALDPIIVAKALPTVHPGWGTTAEFLEKILEFRFWLPQPEKDDLKNLCHSEIQLLPFPISHNVIRDILSLLPQNPRKLKQLFRGLWRLKEVVGRHDEEELRWVVMILCEHMRTLSNDVFQTLVGNSEFWSDLFVADFGRTEESAESEDAKWIETLKTAVHNSTDLTDPQSNDHVLDTLVTLLKGLRDKAPFMPAITVRYFARLSEEPPIYTWRDYRSLLAEWRTSASPERLKESIELQAKLAHSSYEKGCKELWRTILDHRELILSEGAQGISQEQLLKSIETSQYDLDLAEGLIVGLNLFSPDQRFLGPEEFHLVYKHFDRWQHFDKPSDYSPIREREHRLITEIATRGSWFAPLALTYIRLGELEGPDLTDGSHNRLAKSLVRTLTPFIAGELYDLFSKRGGVNSLWPREQFLVHKYILLNKKSSFYSVHGLSRLRELASQADHNSDINENFYHFLNLIHHTVKKGMPLLSPDEVVPLASDSEIIGIIWKAATARQIQFRMISSLIETRNKLIALAGTDSHLPLPIWITS